MDNKQLRKQILDKDNEISELKVLIDTMQTNLASIIAILNDEQRKSVYTPSLKWCLNWGKNEKTIE